MRSKRFVTALAAGAFLLAACGTSSDGSVAETAPATEAAPAPASAPVTAATTDTAVEGGAVAAPSALQFSAPLVGGGELDATSLAGKPTVFWFWAPT